jgi:hypothetical protein
MPFVTIEMKSYLKMYKLTRFIPEASLLPAVGAKAESVLNNAG